MPATPIEQLLPMGRERGYVLFDEIAGLLPEGYQSGVELDDILAGLAAAGIEAVEDPEAFIRVFDDDPVFEYVREHAKPRLSRGKESALVQQMIEAATKDEAEAAKKELIEANLRLVVKAAMRQQSLRDRITAGNIGLGKAVNTFDSRRGFPFSTYAAWMVRTEIQHLKQGSR
ncbi:MAG: RNA polymerase sigma factor region1.1 domain-containing protein [Bryobacteraceae bacterium]|jgi:hypothetical protein